MRGLFSVAIAQLVRSGFGGPSPFRSFREYRAILTPGFDQPRSLAEMVAAVRAELELARKMAFLAPPSGRLHVVMGGELRFNRRPAERPGASAARDALADDGDGYTYDARERIPKDWFAAAVIEAQRTLRAAPQGVVYCLGTASIDSGSRDGRSVVENRGVAISSGPDSDVVELVKGHPRPVDGAVEAITMLDGEALAVVPVADVLGDARTYLAIAVHADYEIDLARGAVHFPIRPHLLVSPAASWPRRPPPETIDVLLDVPPGSPLDALASARARTWERAPLPGRAIQALDERCYAIGTPLFAALHALLLRSTSRDWVTPKREVSPLPYRLVTIDDRIVVDTGARPLPAEMSDAVLIARAQAIAFDGATLLSHGMGERELATHVATLKALIGGLSRERFASEIIEAVDVEVRRQIASGLDVAEAAYAIDGEAVRAAAIGFATRFALAGIGGTSGYRALVDRVGFTLAEGLVATTYADAMSKRMTARSGDASYLDVAAAASLLEARQRRAHDRAEALRAEIARAADESAVTTSELAERNVAIQEIDRGKDAAEPAQRARRAKLSAEIKDLRETIAREENERAARERELATHETVLEQAEREGRAARASRDARATDVFRPGA